MHFQLDRSMGGWRRDWPEKAVVISGEDRAPQPLLRYFVKHMLISCKMDGGID